MTCGKCIHWIESEDGLPGWCCLHDIEPYKHEKCRLSVFNKIFIVHVKLRCVRIYNRITEMIRKAKRNRARKKMLNRPHRDKMLAMWNRMKL